MTNKYIKIIINNSIQFYIIVICILYGIFIGSNFVFRYLVADIYDEHWIIILECAVFSFTLLHISSSFLVRKICIRNNIDSRYYFRSAILIVLTLFLILIIHDEPPIKNKYSWRDLPAPSKTANSSYELMYRTLESEENKTINLTDIDIWAAIENPVKHEKKILKKWMDIQSSRQLIDELDTFERIEDLSTIDNVIDIRLMNIVYITRIYGAYAALLAQKGKSEEAAYHLIKVHSIIRKALPFARFLINKLLWTAAVKQNIKNAYRISNTTGSNNNTLNILKQGFTPLTNKEISYRTVYISEFVFIKHNSKSTDNFDDFFNDLCSSYHLLNDVCSSTFHRLFLKIIAPVIIQDNITANDTIRIFNYLIEGASINPPNFNELDKYRSQFFKKPGLRNIGGWELGNSFIADLDNYAKDISKTKVKSDLLAIFLNERTGTKHKIKDYYSGSEYLKTGLQYIYKSAGPDGLPETKDDIKL